MEHRTGSFIDFPIISFILKRGNVDEMVQFYEYMEDLQGELLKE